MVTIIWENIILSLLIILLPLALIAGLVVWLILGGKPRKR